MREGDGRAGKMRNMPKSLGEKTSVFVHLELVVEGKQEHRDGTLVY